MPLLSFIFMMGLLIYKFEPFWQEVSVESLILRWPLRPVGLLFYQNAVSSFEAIWIILYAYFGFFLKNSFFGDNMKYTF